MGLPLLSICIPTYNRSVYLEACLDSLTKLPSSYWDEVEVLISDNASTDNTREVVERYQHLAPIRYFCNATNIGGERNFFAAAGRGSAGHVWVFGDDDEFEEGALSSALAHIKRGYDLIVLNYSCWSSDMGTKVLSRGINTNRQVEFTDANAVLASLGSQLGYISSIVVRKEMYLSVPPHEYEPYVQYGFSHLYATYCGIFAKCRAILLPDSVFRRREDNCEGFLGPDALERWNKYFIDGTALIFDTLGSKGYSARAVGGAKNQVLRDFVIPKVLLGMPGVDRSALLRRMYRLYKKNWRFWAICVPGLLAPRAVLKFAHSIYVVIRTQMRKATAMKVHSGSAGVSPPTARV